MEIHHALETKQTNYKLSCTYVRIMIKLFSHLYVCLHAHIADDGKNNSRNLKCFSNELSFHVLIMSHNCFGIFADDALCVVK